MSEARADAAGESRALFTTLVGGAGFGASWFLSLLYRVPLLVYLPVERRWTWAGAPDLAADAVWSDFYGRLLFCAASATLVGAIAAIAWRRRPVTARTVLRAFAWATTTLALSLLLAGALVLHHRYVPAPLPEGYVPR